jgi:hypothetical protein
MGWIRAVAREIYGLFVDDGAFALLILLWLAIVWQGLPRLGFPPQWTGALLFAGLALLLVGSAMRYARRGPGAG